MSTPPIAAVNGATVSDLADRYVATPPGHAALSQRPQAEPGVEDSTALSPYGHMLAALEHLQQADPVRFRNLANALSPTFADALRNESKTLAEQLEALFQQFEKTVKAARLAEAGSSPET